MRKSLLFFVLLFMAVPAMAASNVTIGCTNTTISGDPNWVIVTYSSDTNRIRAFGLDITTDYNGIDQVTNWDPNYRIYPGQINFVNNDVNSYGTPYNPSSLPSNHVTIEMGSLYTTDANYAYGGPYYDANAGYNAIPQLSGTLLNFHVNEANECNYYVDINALRGGIVMEDPTEDANVNHGNRPLYSGQAAGSGCGPQTCTVPLEFNVTPSAAGSDLTTKCSCLGWGSSQGGEVNCVVTNGNVTRTVPPAGTVATCGTTVNYYVANNPAAPSAASNPSPAANTKCVSLTPTLGWTVGANTNTQNVYFGATNPPASVASGIPASTTTYAPSTLNVYTKYYWRIDELNACGVVTTGTVWCLLTGPQTGKPCCSNEASPCLGDINGDHRVNAADISALTTFVSNLGGPLYRCTTAAGSTTCPPCFDINGDGRVNSADISALTTLVSSFGGPLYRTSCPYPTCP
jgi:hypothetical protein